MEQCTQNIAKFYGNWNVFRQLFLSLSDLESLIYDSCERLLFSGEIKEDLNKWMNMPCAWILKINIVKIAVLFKLI